MSKKTLTMFSGYSSGGKSVIKKAVDLFNRREKYRSKHGEHSLGTYVSMKIFPSPIFVVKSHDDQYFTLVSVSTNEETIVSKEDFERDFQFFYVGCDDTVYFVGNKEQQDSEDAHRKRIEDTILSLIDSSIH